MLQTLFKCVVLSCVLFHLNLNIFSSVFFFFNRKIASKWSGTKTHISSYSFPYDMHLGAFSTLGVGLLLTRTKSEFRWFSGVNYMVTFSGDQFTLLDKVSLLYKVLRRYRVLD